ncbi:MAG: hypothetical protein H7326_08250 [Bdellovibrionaceae bacterium]|nr:hypothetical protein [Pseudobdellovibrionaceae bacterium]
MINEFPKEKTMESTNTKNTTTTNDREENKKSVSHKVGNVIEKAGTKISQAGAEKLGKAVYKAGDKLEHSKDKKPTQ